MKVLIRPDSSFKIGTGHVMRCLTLADALRREGADILFACRDLPGNISVLIEKKGYRLKLLSGASFNAGGESITDDLEKTARAFEEDGWSPELCIVDNYYLDEKWENRMRQIAGRIMVIDDLADRRHDCDVLLDQNPGFDDRYDLLVPSRCEKLLGPDFALLRPEFQYYRERLGVRDGIVRRILVFFGGTDPTDETTKALEAISKIGRPDITVDVVVGSSNSRKDEVRELCRRIPNAFFHCQVGNIAELMAAADLALGAGGTTTWERCALGLPSVIISVADNQDSIAESAERLGFGVYLGRSADSTAEVIADELERILKSPEAVREMAAKAAALVDCKGVSRVTERIMRLAGLVH